MRLSTPLLLASFFGVLFCTLQQPIEARWVRAIKPESHNSGPRDLHETDAPTTDCGSKSQSASCDDDPSDDDNDNDNPPAPVICFSERATVQVEGNPELVVSMKDLQVGDRILTKSGKYSPIYSFGHFAPKKAGDFLQLHTTKRGSPLEISKKHMVFLKDQQENPVPANAIKVGDVLLDYSTGGGATVTQIKTLAAKPGLFAPLTSDGTVVVDDLVASSYVAFFEGDSDSTKRIMPFGLSQHTYVHWGLAPLRLVCRIGGSELFCNTYNKDGYPYYVALAIKINRFAANQHATLGYMILSLVVMVTGMVHLVEYILLDASWFVSVLVAYTLVAVWWMRKRSLKA